MATAETQAKVKGTYGTMYYVTDVPKTAQWFKERLGVKATFESPDWTEFSVAGHSLCLHKAGKDATGKEGKPNNTSLILHVDGLRPMVEGLKAKGVTFQADVHEVHPGAYAATFVDPDGNLVGLYEGPKGA